MNRSGKVGRYLPTNMYWVTCGLERGVVRKEGTFLLKSTNLWIGQWSGEIGRYETS